VQSSIVLAHLVVRSLDDECSSNDTTAMTNYE